MKHKCTTCGITAEWNSYKEGCPFCISKEEEEYLDEEE